MAQCPKGCVPLQPQGHCRDEGKHQSRDRRVAAPAHKSAGTGLRAMDQACEWNEQQEANERDGQASHLPDGAVLVKVQSGRTGGREPQQLQLRRVNLRAKTQHVPIDGDLAPVAAGPEPRFMRLHVGQGVEGVGGLLGKGVGGCGGDIEHGQDGPRVEDTREVAVEV